MQCVVTLLFCIFFSSSLAHAQRAMLDHDRPRPEPREKKDPPPKKTAIVVMPDASKQAAAESTVWMSLDIGAGISKMLPAGMVRFLLSPYSSKGVTVAVEGVGEQLYLGGYGKATAYGGGLRLQIPISPSVDKNLWLVSPGVDVMVSPSASEFATRYNSGSYDSIVFVATTADASRVFQIWENLGVQAGLRIGGLVSLGGKDAQYKDTGGQIIPIAGLFLGLRPNF